MSDTIYSTDPRDMELVKRSIPCQTACPAGTNIPAYIRAIHEKDYGRSYDLNRRVNILPGVLGRICTRPCEEACRHGESDLGEPVSICWLKRAASDLKSPLHRFSEALYHPTGKTVAVIGAGPAGIAASHELALMGHRVTLYEAFEKTGGMLRYGIPFFRLPEKVLETEIESVLRTGIELKSGMRIGEDITLDELRASFEAVIIATGCQTPYRLNVPGEGFENVYNGLDFMFRINQNEKPFIGRKIMIIGGGFTAIDCARSSVRLGAEEVVVNVRKTEEYLPIDAHEIFEAKLEGIQFRTLVETVEVTGSNGKVEGVVFRRNKLEFDTRPPFRKAVPIPGSEFTVEADSVIAAIGQSSELGSILGTKVDSNNYTTDLEGVFAAGDCLSGSSNVISAIAEGRGAAVEVDRYLTGVTRKALSVRLENTANTDRNRSFDFIPKTEMETIGLSERLTDPENEVETGLTGPGASEEAKRCYLCNLKYEIDISRCIYCSACIDVAPRDCIRMIRSIAISETGGYEGYQESDKWADTAAIYIDPSRCIRCGKCHEVCPVDCITITKTELVEKTNE